MEKSTKFLTDWVAMVQPSVKKAVEDAKFGIPTGYDGPPRIFRYTTTTIGIATPLRTTFYHIQSQNKTNPGPSTSYATRFLLRDSSPHPTAHLCYKQMFNAAVGSVNHTL